MELNEPFNFDITHILIVCDTTEHIYNDAGMVDAKLTVFFVRILHLIRKNTSRHLITRVKEHASSKPVGAHFDSCNGNKLTMENVSIITSARTITQLLILEALSIKAIKPELNKKDEYRKRTLTIKL